MAVPSSDLIWADFNPDGSVHEPNKVDVRRWARYVQALAEASGGPKSYLNKASMDLDTGQADGTVGVLRADPNDAFNFPTLWVFNDADNVWVQGIDRIGELAAEMAAEFLAVHALLDPLAENVIPNSPVTVGDVELVQHFSTPVPGGGRRISSGLSADFFWTLFKGLALPGIGGGRITKSSDPDAGVRFVGSNRRVWMQLHADPAKTFGPWSRSGASGGVANPLGADLIHFIVYGQSLGEGSESLPVVSLAQTGHNAYKFVRGVRTWKLDAYALDPTARPASEFDLMALTEAVDGATGETISTALAATIKELICGPNSPIRRDGAPQILVSFAGRGGRYLDELAKVPVEPDGQGAYYATTVDDVRRARQYAMVNGKSYAVGGVVWMQGEANNTIKITRSGPVLAFSDFVAQYQAGLIAMADNLDADIRAITLQPGRVPFFTYQTGGAASGQAQLSAALAAPSKIIMLGPTYYVPGGKNSYYGSPQSHGAAVHLAADGQRWFGSNSAKGMYRSLVLREQEIAIRPLWAKKIDARTFEVTFKVPRPPLQIDTAWFPAQGGASLGFALYQGTYAGLAAGASPAQGPVITGVSVVDVDRLRFTTASDLPGTPSLAHGQFSRVATVSLPVASWADGPVLPNGNASKDMTFAGLISAEFTKLLDEGAFFIDRVSPSAQNTAWVARSLLTSGGQTILRGEAAEALVTFAPGDVVATSRQSTFGNIRDSDPALSPLSFADHTYGTRSGPYPLQNRLVSFCDLLIT